MQLSVRLITLIQAGYKLNNRKTAVFVNEIDWAKVIIFKGCNLVRVP